MTKARPTVLDIPMGCGLMVTSAKTTREDKVSDAFSLRSRAEPCRANSWSTTGVAWPPNARRTSLT